MSVEFRDMMEDESKDEANLYPYAVELDDSKDENYTQRILLATATTGLVRVEWVQARYGQLIPVNWTQVQYMEYIPGYYPLRYLVADAQNLIVQVALERNFQWLLLWEHDVCPPPDALMRINRYMIDKQVPIVSGLYYTRSMPSMPLIFRGRGSGVYDNFKKGDLVWADGVPTGFLLIHMSILRAMYDEAEPYILKNRQVRRIFITPRMYEHLDNGETLTVEGTSDLDWCTRVMKGGYFKKAGWPDFQRRKYPFLVDTGISCYHINPDGMRFPLEETNGKTRP